LGANKLYSNQTALLLSATCGGVLTLTTAGADCPATVPGQTRATPPTGELTYTEYRNDQWHFETDIPSDLITTSAPQKKKSTGTGMPALHY
jgi:hypothetical protein